MSVITPKDLSGRSFSTSFRGYNKEEVDEYINKVLKNYSFLYRRCAELEEQVAVANLRLENIDSEEKRAHKTLDSANETSNRIISEAYERADDILVSIKKNCDVILRDFRDKVDAQKDALAEMNARVELFKKDIFEKYRAHIELIENLTPGFDYSDALSANEHVARVISELKHDIAAEYDISVGYDENRSIVSENEELPTEEEINAFINDITKKNIIEEEKENTPTENIEENEPLPQDALPQDEKAPEETGETEEKKVVVHTKVRSPRKKKNDTSTILEMLREYEEEDARNIPKIEAQLMLDIDSASDTLIETKTGK